MISLEKILIVRQLPFLTNDQRLLLAEKFSERELYGLTQSSVEEVLQVKLTRRIYWRKVYPKIIHTQLYLLQLQNICSLVWGGEDYPALLKEIYDPPFVLFYKGVLPKLPSLAVVGARRACAEAIMYTREIGRTLACAGGVSVISGLAHGIDTAIHEGLIEKYGQSFSVLATSLDDIYPKTNRSLAGAILYYGGGLLSETAPLETIGKYSFAKRNRIISGLSLATLVMAAEHKSGALITAQFALDEGREVYIWDNEKAGAGARAFLQQGANAFRSLEDLNSILGLDWQSKSLMREDPKQAPLNCETDEQIRRNIEDKLVDELIKELNFK